jgi:NAD(P)-dependent dehydrogenase (short-subunit alcohol dehydrogenase family)
MESEFGSEVLPLACDVREVDQVEKMFADAVSHFGKVDVVLNNAAGNFYQPYRTIVQ